MDAHLSNPDLAPTPPEKRTWSKWNLAALWVGMSVCIPTYTWFVAFFVAGVVYALGMTLVARPGEKHG